MRYLSRLRPAPRRAGPRFSALAFGHSCGDAQTAGLAAVLLAGVAVGSMLQAAAAPDPYLTYFTQQYLQGRSTASFSAAMTNAVLNAIAPHLLALFFSMSCIGAPFLLCIPFLRGIFIGCISSYLYLHLGMRGLAANLILFWLPEVAACVFLVIFVRAALTLSLRMFRTNLLGEALDSGIKTDSCLRCFAVTACGTLLSAVLESILSAVFAPVLLL